MAIELVAGSNVSLGSPNNTDTMAVNVGTGSNRLLVVVFMSDDGETISDTFKPTYNAVELVKADKVTGSVVPSPIIILPSPVTSKT